ncbi:hypothetical protein QAD02_018452 [Eretmocerus hayati]|uniref:Uncharacterized protein n=1 Tax=Eretmocerus hayati TaxID=131215 RepID=A0ACC2PGF2_9HYME|nr:hypothetical protein QAD02_018452 [Eretmocerus hayati]
MGMMPETFDYILDSIKDDLMRNYCNLHTRCIQSEQRLMITMKFMLTGNSYKSLSLVFACGGTTVSVIMKETLGAIWDRLFPVHMPPLTKEILERSAEEFERRWHSPHCCGALDCKHCRIRNPNNAGSIFFNYKHFFSMVLQAVVGADYRFMSIDVGGYEQRNDGGTFQTSNLCRCLEMGNIRMPAKKPLPDSDIEVPHFFIADQAYPISDNILKNYPGESLSKSKQEFNEQFNKVRRVVECGFGQMTMKFRMLLTPLLQHPATIKLVIKCACLLHNLIKDREQQEETFIPTERSNLIPETEEVVFGNGTGIRARDDLRRWFDEHGNVRRR